MKLLAALLHRFPPRRMARAVLVLCLPLVLAPPSPGAERPTPPAEPAVRPEIVHPRDLDADFDRIDDVLQMRIAGIRASAARETDPAMRALIDTGLDESVRVELLFSGQVSQKHIDAFLSLGGRIAHLYTAVSYGWNGALPLRAVEALPSLMGEGLVAVVADRPARLTLDEATRCGRIRPLWASGYAGDSSTTIAILDTGVDDSHPDLAGRMAYWKDWTSNNEPQPRDIIQHGTHVTGIALGTGASAGASTGTLYYTDSGDLSGLLEGEFFPSPIHILTASAITFSSTARWTLTRTTELYQVFSDDGSLSPYGIGAAASGTPPADRDQRVRSRLQPQLRGGSASEHLQDCAAVRNSQLGHQLSRSGLVCPAERRGAGVPLGG